MDLRTLTVKHKEYLECLGKINEYYHIIGAPQRTYNALMEAENVAHVKYLSLLAGFAKEMIEKQQKVWETVVEKTG